MRRVLLLALVCACSPALTAPAPSPGPAVTVPADLVIRNVRLFDGRTTMAAATVVVRGGVIASVEPGTVEVAAIAVVDGTNMTLLPGLIDAHTHIRGPEMLRQALSFGVTTELDMFALPTMLKPLKRIVHGKEEASFADFRSAGTLATAPGGHGTEYGFAIPTLTAPDQAQAFVDARIAEGSDYIKIVYDDGRAFGLKLPTLSRAILEAVITAAHARDKKAVVHVHSQAEAQEAIEAGADGLAHVFFAAPTPAMVELAVARKIFITDTLAVLFSACDGTTGPALAADPELLPLLGPADVRALRTSVRSSLPAAPACEDALQAVQRLHAAGVPMLASTDAPNPGTLHGASMHDELALLVRAGLTPVEALAAATAAPARAFELADRGVIAVGKRADLLLVRGDPTTDITATRAIVGVWKQGVRLDREARITAVRDEHAAIAALRAAPPPPGSETGKISDFERGDLSAAFGAGWQPASDALYGGTSTVTLDPIARKTGHALRMSGTVAGKGPASYAGAMFFPGAAPLQPANLGRFKQLTFSARAAVSTKLTIMLFASQLGAAPGRTTVQLGPRWTQHSVPLATLADIEPYDVMGLFLGATTPGSFTIELDDIRLE